MEKVNELFAIENGITSNGQTVSTLYKTHGKWDNGDLFELHRKSYIKSFYDLSEADLKAAIEQEIFLNDWARWNKGLSEGQKVEINEATYMDQLGCLPPHKWQGSYFEVGEPHHHDNKGRAIHRACWIEEGNYYTGYPKQ